MAAVHHHLQKHQEQQPIKKQTNSLGSPQTMLIIAAALITIILSFFSISIGGIRQGILLWIGLLLGYTLFHARFGFTSAFRRLLSVGNGEGIRAHMLMLVISSTLFAIILSTGISFFGGHPKGDVSPVGTSLIFGAFIFGIGMQLGGGCASGTLYAVGGGRSEMFLTLIAFIAGSVIGAWHFDFWVNQMPSFKPISLATSTGLGYFGAWAVQIIIFGFITLLTLWIEKKRRPPRVKPLPTASGWKRIFRGSWPLWIAAIVLAVLNAAVLMVRRSPWGITSGFALWGSKIASALGIDVSQWGYWSGGRAASLHQSIFTDSTSVLDFGILIGAFLASTLGGLFLLKKITLRRALAAIIGGLLMGYGARLAFGCNIGAYFSGISSFSLHGWVWMIMALIGSYAALYLRPLFGMSNPNSKDHFC
ncbi:putative membrane protein YedE/YeeE [Scopulibacillus daqui]|uniref:Membrane protein YedE/YeeE n=1 Tax=Scopulibacillus daqui TaxID=1469162 RepID=A0ABS2Q179_9BACL|nr:YeeE/YedE family protein [Scopulibacillus daqui]MBM7645439.1 putative membrane protein YedE/YeeE [Scopulibacillus daqui]